MIGWSMRRLRRGALIGLVLVMGALATLVGSAPSAPALSSDGQYFFDQINALRTSLGLQTMQIDPNLQELSEQWAPYMASNPPATFVHPDVTAGITTPYIWVGDNIAFGPTDEMVWNDFLNSPVHYANLTDPRFDRVGIGVARAADGSEYVITRFLASAPVDTPTEPPQQEAAPPPPAVTDTTAPPPAEVEVLGETLVKPVNMAVIPSVRYGITTTAVAAVPLDQTKSSSKLPALLLALALALLLLLAAALFIQSRRRAART